MKIRDASERIEQDLGDLVRIRCYCGCELSYAVGADDWLACHCGRRYQVVVQTKVFVRE